MADAPVVTPSTLNTPKPQAAPVAETKPAAPTIEEREAAIAKREQAYKAELQKFTASKGGLGQKLSEYEKLKKEVPELQKYREERERERELAKLNPPEYLKSLYGEKWYDTIVSAHVNGVPPADLIAARVSEIERNFKNELEKRDAQVKTQAEEAAQREEQETRAMVADNCTAYFTSKADEYPLLGTYGDAARIGAAVAKYIEQEFLKDGKTLLTPQEACEKLEAAEYARLEKAASAPRYATKLQERSKSVTVPSSSQGSGAQGESQSQRRTLSTHLTASTSQAQAPSRRTDAEREEAASRVFNEVRSRRKA